MPNKSERVHFNNSMNESLEGTIALDVPVAKSSLRTYIVRLSVNLPYPKTFEYRSEATTIAPAVSRAIKMLRKEIKGKRIKELSLKAVQL